MLETAAGGSGNNAGGWYDISHRSPVAMSLNAPSPVQPPPPPPTRSSDPFTSQPFPQQGLDASFFDYDDGGAGMVVADDDDDPLAEDPESPPGSSL